MGIEGQRRSVKSALIADAQPLLHGARAGWLRANSDFVFVSGGNQMLKIKRP